MMSIGTSVHIVRNYSQRGKLNRLQDKTTIVVSEPVGPCFRNMPSFAGDGFGRQWRNT